MSPICDSADTTSVIQVVTTVETKEQAESLADLLLDKRLAACVQILGPIVSRYRWKGKIETATEWRCAVKSTADVREALFEAIRQSHPYEVPEILAVVADFGSSDYIRWVNDEVK